MGVRLRGCQGGGRAEEEAERGGELGQNVEGERDTGVHRHVLWVGGNGWVDEWMSG